MRILVKFTTLTALTVVLSMGAAAQDVTILSDDFSSGSVAASQGRVYETNMDSGWNAAWGPNGVSAWTINTIQMENSATNAGNYPDAVPAEGVLYQLFSNVTDTNNTIIASFDYNVSEGDVLYVHFWGLDGTFDFDGEFIANTQGGNGALPCTGGNNTSTDGVDIWNLKDGTAASGSAATALVALTGSGTYSVTNELSALNIDGINETGDFEYFLVGLAKTEDGTVGTTSIDNLLIKSTYTVPPPPPPVGIVWENDMSTDPISGAEPNWVVRGGGSGYTIGGGLLTMNASAWSTILDTNPYNEFQGITKIDLEWRATSYSPETTVPAAGLWCNVSGDAPDYGGIHFDAILLSNDTQIVNIVAGNTDPILATHTGFGPGMLSLSAAIDGYQETIDYIISDGVISVTNSVSYTALATAGTTVGCTLFTSGASAEVDYVRIEANAAPDEVYFAVDPEELVMQVVESGTTAQDSLDITYNAATNLDLTITISDESHPGSFSVLSDTPQVLVVPGSGTLEFEFDRTVANLLGGDVATGLVTLAWSETGGGESGQVVVPITGGVSYAPGQASNWTGDGDGVHWGDPDNWELDRVPGQFAADNPFIQHGAVVTVATNAPDLFAPLPRLIVRDNTVDGSTLNIQADLPAISSFEVGLNSGYIGFVNHSAGTVDGGDLTVGSDSGWSNSIYSLTGGSLTATEITLGTDGILDINGGTFTLDNSAEGQNLSGAGRLRVRSGTYQTVVTVATTADNYTCGLEISGGTVNIGNQGYYTGGLTIIGDEADVNIDFLNSGPSSVAANINYIFDESGVSTIDGSGSWCSLGSATINIDGSAYTGGTAEFILLQSSNIAGTSTAVNVTGFAPGVTTRVSQELGAGAITLMITVPGYPGWIPLYGVTGPEAAWDADADLDSEINWYEYVMGGDPTNPAVQAYAPLGAMIDDGGTEYFEYVYVRRTGSGAELDYIPEFTEDLTLGWSPVGITEVGSAVLVGDEDYETVTNRIEITGMAEGFMHVIINDL